MEFVRVKNGLSFIMILINANTIISADGSNERYVNNKQLNLQRSIQRYYKSVKPYILYIAVQNVQNRCMFMIPWPLLLCESHLHKTNQIAYLTVIGK